MDTEEILQKQDELLNVLKFSSRNELSTGERILVHQVIARYMAMLNDSSLEARVFEGDLAIKINKLIDKYC